MKKRFACALLAVLLCLSALSTQVFARDTAYFSPLPRRFDFNSMHLDGSCVPEMDAACADALSLLAQSGAENALLSAWNRMSALSVEIDLQFVLTSIRYHQDPRAYSEAYTSIVSGRNAARSLLLQTQQTLLRDPNYGPSLRLYIGYQQAAALLAETAPDAELLELLRQENELVIRYQKAAQEDPVQMVNGKAWTLRSVRSAYLADPSEESGYLQLYYDLYARRNETLGQIFLELTQLRARIAALCGYDDYAQYAHSTYNRDYSLSEAAVFRGEVKQRLTPLFRTLSLAVRCGVFADGTEYSFLGQEALLDAISPYMDTLSGELAESWRYMRDCHLIDAEFSAGKLSSTFTVSLPTLGTAYVNCYRQGSNRDLFNVVHEFGHFNAFTRCVTSSCYDALEVHSQGLEMLYLHFADALFGDRAAQQSGYELYRMLHSVMAGCMFDELQLYAYTADGLTLDDLNRKSAELAAQYGLPTLGPAGVDYSWVEVGHTYESPMYYISYATSAFAALEIWLLSQTAGLDAAADFYLRFVVNSIDVPGYRGPIIVSEMDDPFRDGTIDAFSTQLSRIIYRGLCGAPYEDVEGSPAEGDIVLLYLLGILNGTSDTTFSPARTLTRGMAVTALYRAVNEPGSGIDAAKVFSDVAPDAWYTQAVAWAVETGVTNGTTDTTFSPDRPVTCQEFAAMLYRQHFGPDYDYTGSPAPDGAAAWAGDALIWSREQGAFAAGDGLIAPATELCRADFAAALVSVIYE